MNSNNNSVSNQLAAAKQGAGSKKPQYSRCLAQISWPEARRASFSKLAVHNFYVYGFSYTCWLIHYASIASILLQLEFLHWPGYSWINFSKGTYNITSF